jgi:transcriptional regulator with XRE-family HTH domain
MKLRAWRAQRVLTQKDLAEKAGVAEVTVAAIERGVQLPSARTSRKLAEALEVAPTDIDEVNAAIEREMKRELKKDLAR